MKNELWDDQIRAYLSGKLPPLEKEDFERMLRADPEIAEEVTLRRAEIASAELLIAAETRQLFKQWRTEKPSHTLFPGIRPLAWTLAVAVGLFVVLFSVYQLRPPSAAAPAQTIPLPPPARQSEPNPVPAPEQPQATAPPGPSTPAQKPHANYWAIAKQRLPDPLSSNLRVSTTDSTRSIFQQAQQAYTAGNYQRSLDLLALTDSTRQQSATYLSAHALFQLRRFDAAAAAFERLITRNSRQFRFQSEWGLLMCRLADRPRHEKEFRQQLDAILAQPQHPYFEQARMLEGTLK